jgi:hypothetical protein
VKVTRRRRISRELDRLLGVERGEVVLVDVDLYADGHLDLTVPERDRAGRALLGAAT